MKQTFTYKEKFTFSYCYPAIALVALAILTAMFKYGIKVGGMKLFLYPNSLYVLGVGAVVAVGYALYKFNQAKTSAKNANPIVVTDTTLSFPKGSEASITVNYPEVNELWSKTDEDHGREVVIFTHGNKNRYEFREDRFDSAAEFSKFEMFMNQYCTNITNR